MTDIPFFVEFTASLAVVSSPIVLIVRLLAAHAGVTIGDLFVPASDDLPGPRPGEEDPPPRWRPELIRARHRAAGLDT